MTDYRDLPEITAAWREIAELAGLDEEMKYDDATEFDRGWRQITQERDSKIQLVIHSE